MSFDWKGLVGTVAPTIAATFGTPLMGMGVKALCNALGLTHTGNEETDHTALEAKLAGATPAELLAIKTADQQFEKDMKQLDIDLAKLDTEDRNSARQMQMANRSWVPGALAILAVVVVAALAWYVISATNINEYAKGVILLLLGRFLGYIDNIYSFEFGTTRTSRVKDDTIQKLSANGKDL